MEDIVVDKKDYWNSNNLNSNYNYNYPLFSFVMNFTCSSSPDIITSDFSYDDELCNCVQYGYITGTPSYFSNVYIGRNYISYYADSIDGTTYLHVFYLVTGNSLNKIAEAIPENFQESYIYLDIPESSSHLFKNINRNGYWMNSIRNQIGKPVNKIVYHFLNLNIVDFSHYNSSEEMLRINYPHIFEDAYGSIQVIIEVDVNSESEAFDYTLYKGLNLFKITETRYGNNTLLLELVKPAKERICAAALYTNRYNEGKFATADSDGNIEFREPFIPTRLDFLKLTAPGGAQSSLMDLDAKQSNSESKIDIPATRKSLLVLKDVLDRQITHNVHAIGMYFDYEKKALIIGIAAFAGTSEYGSAVDYALNTSFLSKMTSLNIINSNDYSFLYDEFKNLNSSIDVYLDLISTDRLDGCGQWGGTSFELSNDLSKLVKINLNGIDPYFFLLRGNIKLRNEDSTEINSSGSSSVTPYYESLGLGYYLPSYYPNSNYVFENHILHLPNNNSWSIDNKNQPYILSVDSLPTKRYSNTIYIVTE